jgi:DNA-binding beta-propeller fold protein YncE
MQTVNRASLSKSNHLFPGPMRISAAILLSATTAAAQAPATGRLLVANQQAASASIIELSTGAVTHVPVGNGPHEAAISPDGKWGFITIYGVGGPQGAGNQIAVIDMDAKKVARMIDLGQYTRPHSVVPVAGSPLKLIVSSETTQNAVVVDAEKGMVIGAVSTQAPASHMVAVQADGKRAYSANIQPGTITVLDMVSGKATGTVAIGPRSEGLATTADGNEVWVGSMTAGTVSVVNVAAMKVDTVLSGFGVPYRMAVSHDSKLAVIVEAEANRIGVIDARARKLLGSVEVGGSPRGVSISPDSKWAFITLGPQNEVVVVELATRKVIGRYTVQTAPDGIAYSAR